MIMVSNLHLKYSNTFLIVIISRVNQFQISIHRFSGKVEAYNKIVKNEFLKIEDIASINDRKVRYGMFVKAYNEDREHGGINGLTPSEMFLLQTFNKSNNYKRLRQESVTPIMYLNVQNLIFAAIALRIDTKRPSHLYTCDRSQPDFMQG
jgi:Integrase core domain